MNAQAWFANAANTICIDYDEAHGCALYTMSGHVELDDYKQGFEQLLALLKERRGYKTLFDYSHLVHDPALGRAWFTGIYAPRAYKELGGKFCGAVVQSQNLFQRLTTPIVASSLRMAGLHFDLEYFPDPTAAQAWLAKR